jgi:checkpoint serine/threonine-protein kinase
MSDAVASSIMKHGHERYALMLKPPSGQNRRPEKLRFNLGLLFTPDGTEYCVQEARAKSMGLLGKKWPPPPSPLNSSAAASSSRDNGTSARGMSSKKVYAEPTVTIATKEALADVFGMYNSPEKTLRFGAPVGSKHAPVRKIEPTSSMKTIKAPTFEGSSTGGKGAGISYYGLNCDH